MSKNPFKLLGSYLGAIIGAAAFIYLITNYGLLKGVTGVGLNWLTFRFFLLMPDLYTWIISGFTLGWGVHSILRKLVKHG